MLRFLLCSDIHTYIENVPLALRQVPDAQAVIISGDLEVDGEAVRKACGDIPVFLVCGNHDPYLEQEHAPRELLIDTGADENIRTKEIRPLRRPLFRRRKPPEGAHRILLTHGNLYDVPSLVKLRARAEKYGADIVIFGHTHEWVCERDERSGILFLNPGSLMGEAGKFRDIGCGSFAVMTVDGKRVKAEHYLL